MKRADNSCELSCLRICCGFTNIIERFELCPTLSKSLSTLDIRGYGAFLGDSFWPSFEKFVSGSQSLESLSLTFNHYLPDMNQLVSFIHAMNRPRSVKNLTLNITDPIPQNDRACLSQALSELRFVDRLGLSLVHNDGSDSEQILSSLRTVASNHLIATLQFTFRSRNNDRLLIPVDTLKDLIVSFDYFETVHFETAELSDSDLQELSTWYQQTNMSTQFEFNRCVLSSDDTPVLSASARFSLVLLRTLAGAVRTNSTPIPLETILYIARRGLQHTRYWSDSDFSVISKALLDRRTLGVLRHPEGRVSKQSLLIYCKRLNMLMAETTDSTVADPIT